MHAHAGLIRCGRVISPHAGKDPEVAVQVLEIKRIHCAITAVEILHMGTGGRPNAVVFPGSMRATDCGWIQCFCASKACSEINQSATHSRPAFTKHGINTHPDPGVAEPGRGLRTSLQYCSPRGNPFRPNLVPPTLFRKFQQLHRHSPTATTDMICSISGWRMRAHRLWSSRNAPDQRREL